MKPTIAGIPTALDIASNRSSPWLLACNPDEGIVKLREERGQRLDVFVLPIRQHLVPACEELGKTLVEMRRSLPGQPHEDDPAIAIDLVHLRAAWFMENTLAWLPSVAKHGRMAWYFEPELEMPWVATDDIAGLAEKELTHPTGEHRVIREVGSEDLTMTELAAMIGTEIGRPVEYRYVDSKEKEVEEEFLARSGAPERWLDEHEPETFMTWLAGREA